MIRCTFWRHNESLTPLWSHYSAFCYRRECVIPPDPSASHPAPGEEGSLQSQSLDFKRLQEIMAQVWGGGMCILIMRLLRPGVVVPMPWYILEARPFVFIFIPEFHTFASRQCGVMATVRPKASFSAKHLESDLAKLLRSGSTERHADILERPAACSALAAALSYSELLTDSVNHRKFDLSLYDQGR